MMLDFLYRNLDNPSILLYLVPILILIFLIVRLKVRMPHDEYLRRKRFRRWFVFSRFLIYVFLFLALASPFTIDRSLDKGDSSIVIISDDSASFEIFDKGVAEEIKEILEDKVEVDLVKIGDKDKTPLGDSILENLEDYGNILLVTDGYSNSGTSVGDTLLRATDIKGTINAVKVEPIEKDSSITIRGPDKVAPGVKTLFTINVKGTDPGEKHIIISVDGKVVKDTVTSEESITIFQEFLEGTHDITANLLKEDYYKENNIYYKTVKVIDRPAILFYSEGDSPLVEVIKQLYDVDVVSDLNSINNAQYYALIINDISAQKLKSKINIINDFLSDDNGLLVIGGENSYDSGGYKGSKFEDILPVVSNVAKEKEEGMVNIVVALDISRSTSVQYGFGSVSDVEKAIAISVIENLKDSHNVGVIAFNTQAYVVSDLSPLGEKREELLAKISSLEKTGDSYVPSGVEKAIGLVSKANGGKNIIFISDGKSGGISKAKNSAEKAKKDNVVFYGVGVGDACIKYNKVTGECDEWSSPIYGVNAIKSIALAGGGSYFHGEKVAQRVKILFGDPEKGGRKEEYSLIVKDSDHFITNDLGPLGKITGFNNVVPKSTTNILISADTGEPVLSVWRYGVGRVASFSTDDGRIWAGNMLDGEHSLLFTKTINWIIGDPEKKSKNFIYIADTNIKRSTEVAVKSPEKPEVDGLDFYKKGEDLYVASFMPENQGFQELMSVQFAVNYNKELEGVGMNANLQNIVSSTGGKIYDIDAVSELIDNINVPYDRPAQSKKYYEWLFVLVAMIIFLVEIFFRRLSEQ